MAQRWWTFVIWAAAAACAVFWVLRLGVSPIAVPSQAALALDAAPPSRADLSRLLGAPLQAASAAAAPEPEPVAESARFRLLGVIAGGRGAGGGVALLVVDGRPPRPYRVGAPIDAGLMVQSVTRRGVAIGPPGAPPSVRLELPPPPPPATGELPRLAPDGRVVGGGAPGALPPPAPPFPQPPLPGTYVVPGMPGMPVMPAPPPPEAVPPEAEPANR